MPSAAALPSASAGFWSRLAAMGRAGQVLSSFAAVVGGYCLYWLIAVPLIEPNIEPEAAARTSDEEIQQARQHTHSRRQEIANYFSAGCWELESPSIWYSEQSRLLFKDLSVIGKDSVKLSPCTMLFFPKSANPAAANVEPIVMRAVEGATVRFDQPIALKNVDPRNASWSEARLTGPITIYRRASRPGAGDDLEITTHDVKIDKGRIWTEHGVQFRLGRSRGSGRDLELHLASAGAAPATAAANSTIRALELKHDVKMQLDLGSGPLASATSAKPRRRSEPPIEIVCQGPFGFDVERNAASFRDYVNVFRPSGAGESDQLTCELLTVYFAARGARAGATSAAADAELPASQVRLIEARGDPVTVRSPSRGIYAHCHGIDYFPAPGEAMGRLVAIGPGAVQGKLPTDATANYDAKWTQEFRFEPAEDGQHRAAIVGGAMVRFVQMGTITADEIFAWLSPKSPPAADPRGAGATPAAGTADGKAPAAVAEGERDSPIADDAAGREATAPVGWQFERLLARAYPNRDPAHQSKVVIVSEQVHGVAGQLEALVDRPKPAADQGAAQALAARQPQPPAPGKPAAQASRPGQNRTQRFDARGGLIRLRLQSEGEQLAVSTVTIEHQARLNEITPPRAGQVPLAVEGDRLHVTDANSEATHLVVAGRPGRLDAGGISLWSGTNVRSGTIEMEKRTNRLWIDGPGRMRIPVEQDLNGRPLARAQPLDVTWQGNMAFQGNSVVFQRSVLAQTEQQFLRTEKLEAIFNRPIDFANRSPAQAGKPEDKPQLAHVRCFGPALLKGRQFDERGQQTSFAELIADDLAVNKLTGDVTARGPGSLTQVSRATDRAAAAPAGAGARPRAAKALPANDSLTYLHVRFESFIDGNLNRRTSRFGTPTKAVYGPVNDWNATLNPDDPTSLGPQGMVLDARELEVREMPSHQRRDRGWFELEAHGSVVAEGAQFTARGDHLTYAEEKDQLVLRGDGLSPAEFFQDSPADGSRRASRANELTYWFTLQRVQVTSFQSFDMSVPNNTPPKPAKKKSPFLP